MEKDVQENFSQVIIAAKGTWYEVRHLREAETGPLVESAGLSLRARASACRTRGQGETHLARPRAVRTRSMVVSWPNSRVSAGAVAFWRVSTRCAT